MSEVTHVKAAQIGVLTDEERRQFEQSQAEWLAEINTPEHNEGVAKARLLLAISTRVHQLLEERGWTKRELAKRMGISETNVNRILNAEHNSTLETIAKLDVAFGEKILMTYDEFAEQQAKEKPKVELMRKNTFKKNTLKIEKLPALNARKPASTTTPA